MQETESATRHKLERITQIQPEAPSPPARHGYFRWFLAAALVAAVPVALHYRDEIATRLRSTLPVPVRAIEVRSGVIEQTIRLTGNTVAEKSVLLRAPYLRGRRSSGSGDFGLVLEELAAPGSWVKKNSQAAVFDRLFMLNRLDNYESARVDSELRLRTLRAQLEVKRKAHEQQVRVAKAKMDQAALDLKTVPVRSAIQAALFRVAFEEARATYRSLLAQSPYVKAAAQAEIRLAQLELREAQLEERRAKANVDKMVIRAPVSGVMVAKEIFRGAEFSKIQVGDQVRPRQPYAQIVDLRSILVEATANQVDIERLRVGAPARVRFDGYSDLELPARVSSVGPVAKARGRRGNYVSEVPVLLKLDRTDSRLIPNLTVSVDIILRRERNEEIIPREAVFKDANGQQPFTYVETASGWEKREVELGLANNIDVAVRSGLSSGERVALTDPLA